MFRYTIKELNEFSDERMIHAVMVDRMESCTNVYSPLYKRLTNIYDRFFKLAFNNDQVIGLHFVEEILENNTSLDGMEISGIMRTLREGLTNPKIRC